MILDNPTNSISLISPQQKQEEKYQQLKIIKSSSIYEIQQGDVHYLFLLWWKWSYKDAKCVNICQSAKKMQSAHQQICSRALSLTIKSCIKVEWNGVL